MPIDPTGLTANFNPATNADLWVQLTRLVHPNNGDFVRTMDDEGGADLCMVSTNDGTRPTYEIPSINGLGAIDFAAGLSLVATNLAATVNKASSDFLSASAYTYFVALKTDTATANANPYDNAGPWTDGLANWGCAPSTNGGPLTVKVWHFDGGGIKTVSVPINAGEKYVLVVRFDGSTLRANVNGGTDATVSAGNVASLTNVVRAGRNYIDAVSYTGKLGRSVFYNINQTGTPYDDTLQEMVDTWVTGGVGNTFPALSVAL